MTRGRIPVAAIGQLEVRAVSVRRTAAVLVAVTLVALSPIRLTLGCYTGLGARGN